MNSQEAKRLLEMLRPGGDDSADPQFAKALQQAESDPELGRWLAEQKTFDQGIARSLKGVPVPAELRNTLLAIVPKEQEKENVLRPLFPLWSRWRDWRVTTAAAAVVLLASFGFVLAQYNKPTAFSEFRRELLKEAWGSEAHLEFRSTSFARVRQWLSSQGIADVKLPAGFRRCTFKVARSWKSAPTASRCSVWSKARSTCICLSWTAFNWRDCPSAAYPTLNDAVPGKLPPGNRATEPICSPASSRTRSSPSSAKQGVGPFGARDWRMAIGEWRLAGDS